MEYPYSEEYTRELIEKFREEGIEVREYIICSNGSIFIRGELVATYEGIIQ